MFWFAAGLACGFGSGDADLVFGDSASGGMDGDRDLVGVTVSYDLDFDDEAGSDDEQPMAKADGGATCRGLYLSADLKLVTIVNWFGSLRSALLHS